MTRLPLNLAPGSTIAFIGNLLLDEERRQGHLETLLHQQFPKHKLRVRNFSWPADEVDLQPRPDNFADIDQHMLFFKTDVIFAAFGANESFAGTEGLPAFESRLDHFVEQLKTKSFNGKSAAQIVLLSPVANQNTKAVAAADRNNRNLAAYTRVMRKVAEKHQVGFVDVFSPTRKLFAANTALALTKDGYALNAAGHAEFARAVFTGLFNREAPTLNPALRDQVLEKATQFAFRYKPLNTFYYTGGRNKRYGYLDFLPAMRNFDIMTSNRDAAIHQVAAGQPVKLNDSNVPALDQVAQARGANKWLTPAEELKAFKIDPRFEVNCFASEEDFPELACPIQMRWDRHGRLWVSCSTTYPHVYPGQAPVDKVVILEDNDGDGKADTCHTWADDLHIPLSFVLDGRDGIYVSEEPHFTHLRDTDGDGQADSREVIFSGFGCEDSHHALHDFVWTPGGDLMFRESIFHNSQIETAYGPVRAKNSSWFLYHPSTRRFTAFGSHPNTNPWGVTFDPWGNHVASFPVFASSFHATNPIYPRQHPRPGGIQAYSGVCGHDFISHDFWPEEMQGGLLKARYKSTNKVELHKWIEKEDHFAEEHVTDIVFSSNLSFIPVDLRFGPRGAAYVCDWYNPVKGHAQYSLRDPRRDRKAGRIWRIIPKGARLVDPPKIEGATTAELLEHLKSPHYRTRYWAKRELRARDQNEVLLALKKWLAGVSKQKALVRLEGLWMYQALDTPNPELLAELCLGDDHLVAASAFGPLRFWSEVIGAEKAHALLEQGAKHSSQHVRREAVIAASYIGTPEALDAILPVLDQPAGRHLAYAITTSLGSKNLSRHWQGNERETAVKTWMASAANSTTAKPKKPTVAEKKFDAQPGVQTVRISAIPERLLFTKSKFKVKAGKPVKLIFSNPDATAHNLLILDRETPVAEIGIAGNEMAKDPEAAKKHFIPPDKRILWHTKLLPPEAEETLRFVAPDKPGTYPYVCTFPGHWVLMQGVMTVER